MAPGTIGSIDVRGAQRLVIPVPATGTGTIDLELPPGVYVAACQADHAELGSGDRPGRTVTMTDAATDALLARRLLGMLDLTTLSDGDDGQVVRALAAYAATPVGQVAALCTWSRLIGDALDALAGTGVPVAAVANFPAGEPDVAGAAARQRRPWLPAPPKSMSYSRGGHFLPAMRQLRWHWSGPAARPAGLRPI